VRAAAIIGVDLVKRRCRARKDARKVEAWGWRVVTRKAAIYGNPWKRRLQENADQFVAVSHAASAGSQGLACFASGPQSQMSQQISTLSEVPVTAAVHPR
jgi:hypothetical protein